jgi:NAD(P)-dependent dehydrogenase (short-subunit alcohol dehydrogenase family)
MDPLFDFTGKIVLITGGSRGLGYQMVRENARSAERGGCQMKINHKVGAALLAAGMVTGVGVARAGIPSSSS